MAYLPALRGGVGLLVLVGAHAEVLDGFPSVPLAAEQDGVGTGRCPDGELVEGQCLASSLEDALLGGGREAEGSDGELGELEQADVIGDGADNDDDLGITLRSVLSLLHNARKGNGWAVDLGEEEAVEDGLKQRDRKYVKT